MSNDRQSQFATPLPQWPSHWSAPTTDAEMLRGWALATHHGVGLNAYEVACISRAFLALSETRPTTAERLHGLIEQLAGRFKGYLPWPDEKRDAIVRGHEMAIEDTIRKADELVYGAAAARERREGNGADGGGHAQSDPQAIPSTGAAKQGSTPCSPADLIARLHTMHEDMTQDREPRQIDWAATIKEAADALSMRTETGPRWHKWPEEKPPRCDWYLVKDSRRKTPTVDHYKDWASSGDEWDGAVTHWHPLPEGPHE